MSIFFGLTLLTRPCVFTCFEEANSSPTGTGFVATVLEFFAYGLVLVAVELEGGMKDGELKCSTSASTRASVFPLAPLSP